MKNPFRPSAGAAPPEIIGRAGLFDEFAYGLRLRSGAPGLLSIFTGARGIGKTVMLGAAQDLAIVAGWAVISETATGGFVGRIGESMLRLCQELGDGPPTRRISGFAAAGFSVTTQLPPEKQVDWRTTGDTLLRLLDQNHTGLAITVDEIHAADRGEIAKLAANVQHFIRDGLPIALVFAGLPAAVSDLLNEGVATFLRRADRIDLHAAAARDVEASYCRTFAEGGFSLPTDLARVAAESTGGYPFLIQLVGYFLWQEAEETLRPLDHEAVERAVTAARRRNARTVIEAALSTTSRKDRAFLDAMSANEGPTAIGEITKRLNSKSNTIANYRNRLVAAGLIEPAGYGLVAFAIPGLREHLLALHEANRTESRT
ncbi:ATP-binding protein [Subtercola sp. RTI3]|uniref:ATP-binding protein n=1 Tax=Subtercola sp. RTI3 TaxID=3048639 RepID=UPI002B2269C2|nr:ATP-binding protein [Subtercola sp. RTI3]MEA9987021.1 ATP-binding protein [Subtercola sp. RTI3]